MSLILGYANTSNAIIMSDGRAGENGCVSEHYNKTRKINDNIVIGFSGFAEQIEIFLNHCIKEMGTDISNYYINDYLEMVEFLFNDIETQEKLRSSFIIIGRDQDSKMYTTIIGDNTSYKLKTNLVTSPRVLTIGGSIDGSIINNIYFTNIKNEILSIEERMATTILQVSRLDSSVNSNVFKVTL